MSPAQIEMSKENQKALAELVQAMPSGRLIRIVNEAKHDAFMKDVHIWPYNN